MRNIEFINGEIYHIFNRGTERKKIFVRKEDYVYALIRLMLFNTQDNVPENISRFTLEKAIEQAPTKPLVKFLAFNFIPNHIHLELKQIIRGGISKLLHRFQTAQAKYFNAKYNRSGHLFQGAFKAKHVNRNNYFSYLPLYIHMNTADLLPPNTPTKKILEFIFSYPWSSLKYYVNEKQFPHLETKEYKNLYSSKKDWEDAIKEYLPYYKEMRDAQRLSKQGESGFLPEDF